MRSQKGKILSWIVFAVILVLVFGSLIYFQSIKKISEKAPVTPTGTTETKVQPRKTFAVPDVSEEEKISRDEEAYNKALLAGEGCEDIKYDEELKLTCIDTLLYNDALKDNNETLCEKISDTTLKTKCYDHIYLSLGTKDYDITLCKKITDETLKQSCMDQIQVILGRTASSASSCDVIKDASLKQSCLDNYYFSSSIEKLSEEGCENIRDATLKSRCSATIAKNELVLEVVKTQSVKTFATSAQKLESCDQLTGTSATDCKDTANFNLAYEKKDLTYCNSITDSETKSKCKQTQSQAISTYYMRQAISKNDSSLCSKILDQSLMQICTSSVQ